MIVNLDGVNLILNGINLVMISTVWVMLLRIWRVKFKIENVVGPVPPVPVEPAQPLQQVPAQTVLEPVPTIQQQSKPPTPKETPEEIKGTQPAKKISAKAQKQIDLLTAELERLKNL